MLEGRELEREEIARIWTIDRSEVIEALYALRAGALVREPRHIEVAGWDPEEAARDLVALTACHDGGGWLYGFFDGARLAAVAVLGDRPLGARGDRLQLVYLHVSRADRGRGLGARLFALAAERARARGARYLYVSATPSGPTVEFYLGRGCALAAEPDPELLRREPEDIHLEYDLEGGEAERRVASARERDLGRGRGSRAAARLPGRSAMTRTPPLDARYAIALARAADVPALAAIEIAAASQLAGHAPAEILAGAKDPSELHAARAAGRLWVATADDVPVGFAEVALLADGLPHLEEIDVHPDHGRRGLGAALVRAVCSWAAGAGFAEITLTTFREVPWNAPFYARLGFAEIPPAEIRPALAAVVREETERGLDPATRVAMRYSIPPR